MVTRDELKYRAREDGAVECIELRIWVKRGDWVDLAKRLSQLAGWCLKKALRGKLILGKPWWLDRGLGNWGGDSGP